MYDFSKLISQSGEFIEKVHNQVNTSLKFDRVLDSNLTSLTDYDDCGRQEFASYIDTILSDYPADPTYYKSQLVLVRLFYQDFKHALANMPYRDLFHFASRIRLSMNKNDLELLRAIIINNKETPLNKLIDRFINTYAVEDKLFNYNILLYLICVQYLRAVDCDRLNQ